MIYVTKEPPVCPEAGLSYLMKTPKYSSIPSRLRNLVQELIPPKLPVLVRDGIVERVRPDVPPEAIQPDLGGRRLGASDLEDPRGHPEPRVRRDDLDAGDPLRQLAALAGRQLVALGLVLLVHALRDQADLVREGLGRAEVGVEVAVLGEDVELVGGFLLVL